MGDLGEKVDFSQFYQIFPTFLLGLSLGSYLSHINDLLWFRILQQSQLFEMTPVSGFFPLQTVTTNGFMWNPATWKEYWGFLEKAYLKVYINRNWISKDVFYINFMCSFVWKYLSVGQVNIFYVFGGNSLFIKKILYKAIWQPYIFNGLPRNILLMILIEGLV